MPGRSYNSSSYRYGFNSKENDNEIKGTANQQNYGMRIYDSRAGRFLSVDPLTQGYPSLSPYPFAMNRPIDGVDMDGEEFLHYLIPFEKMIFGTNNIQKFEQGQVQRIVTITQGIVSTARHVYHKVTKTPRYGNGFTTLTFGLPPNFPTPKEQMEKQIDKQVEIVKNVANDYGNLASKTLEGDANAAGQLSVEILLLCTPWEEFSASRGIVSGEKGVIIGKYRAALAGDAASAAEIRVAKMLRDEGKNVHFLDANKGNAAGTGTFDYTVNGVHTDIKRISGLGSNAAGDLAKGVRQVGAGGELIVVRQETSVFTFEQYQQFINNFKPQQNVKIRLVEEKDLPKLIEGNGN